MDLRVLCVVTVLLTVGLADNYQEWSEQTHPDVAHSLYCSDSAGDPFINTDDKLEWMKHGQEMPIVSGDHYELKEFNGTKNKELKIKKVTSEMTGIYFCNIYLPNGSYHGRVHKGLNIGGAKHDDLIDKYESNIITGVVAGAAVFVIIVSFCTIDRFRYLTDEQKQKRRAQKEERLRRLQRHQQNGVDNFGMDNGVPEQDGKKNYYPYDNLDNTHL